MDRSKNFLRKFLILGLVIFAVPVLSAESPFVLQEGVVIDPIGQKVFLMTPDGGIEARNISDGAVIWQSKLAAKPVGFFDGRLYAQTEGENRSNSVELVSFSLTEASRSENFRLPLGQERWVGISHGMGERLDVRVGTDNDRPAVWWTSSVKIPTGANIAAPRESFRQASFVLDLQTGDVKEENLTPPPENKLTAVPAESRIDQQPGQQFLSNDGRHVLVSRRINDNAHPERYAWDLYKVNGSKVGTHRDRFSSANFFINGSVLIYISRPYSLKVEGRLTPFKNVVRAIDLNETSLLWESTLREISYKGPLPP